MSSLQDGIERDVRPLHVRSFLDEVEEEYATARLKFGPCASYHEGAKVVEEEWDKVMRLVYKKVKTVEDYYESHDLIRKELVQVCAMAMAMCLENAPLSIPWMPERYFHSEEKIREVGGD